MLNIQTLRVLTIAASFLFIPAFIYGVASVWSILFATAVGLYSKISLQNIINQCDMVQEPQLESWHVKSAVLFLLFQILVIAAAPQILYLFIYCAKNCIVRQNYDHDFLSGFSTFFIQKQSIFSEEKMIFLSATLFSSILMLLTFCMFS